jgi:DNA/RNA endonuclease G (NUC1)
MMPVAQHTKANGVRRVIIRVVVASVVVAGVIVCVAPQRQRLDPTSVRAGDPVVAASSTGVAAAPPSSPVPASAVRLRTVAPPRSSRPLQLFDYGFFQVGYDNERRAGAWGRYDLSGPIGNTSSQPARPAFRSEPRSSARVASKDYSNPGNQFERGHIVPSYAMWSRHGDEARRATFVMTNVFPQDGDLNGRLWEDIEDDIAGQAKDRVVSDEGYAGRLRAITVIAGPIYESSTRSLPSGIPIPDACFSIIYDLDEATGLFRARAYIVPNQASLTGPTSRYAATIRQIEHLTGLDFMPEGGAEINTLETAAAVREPW